MKQKKKKFDQDEADFDKLVNDYREKFKKTDLKKSKWYESANKS
jgi:hypothetical protein